MTTLQGVRHSSESNPGARKHCLLISSQTPSTQKHQYKGAPTDPREVATAYRVGLVPPPQRKIRNCHTHTHRPRQRTAPGPNGAETQKKNHRWSRTKHPFHRINPSASHENMYHRAHCILMRIVKGPNGIEERKKEKKRMNKNRKKKKGKKKRNTPLPTLQSRRPPKTLPRSRPAHSPGGQPCLLIPRALATPLRLQKAQSSSATLELGARTSAPPVDQ